MLTNITTSPEKRIALLIDCDNVGNKVVEGVIAELANHGRVTIRRAYGNWRGLIGWEKQLLSCAIQPVQQFAYTKGKNATDARMIIDAMDLLYSNKVDAFALMTSDSDFTPLALRILEQGLQVYGFGRESTPKPFVDACSAFIFTEGFSQEEDGEQPEESGKQPAAGGQAAGAWMPEKLRADAALVELLKDVVEQKTSDDGWASMTAVCNHLVQNKLFSPTSYGHKRPSQLIKATELFDIKTDETDPSKIYIRPKNGE